MRKFLVLLLLVAMTIPVAEARRRETPEEIERKTRHYQGWEKGVSLRASLIFHELDRTRIVGEKHNICEKFKTSREMLLNKKIH